MFATTPLKRNSMFIIRLYEAVSERGRLFLFFRLSGCGDPRAGRPFESCASGMAGAVPQLGLDPDCARLLHGGACNPAQQTRRASGPTPPGRCPGKVEAEPRELGSGLPAEDLGGWVGATVGCLNQHPAGSTHPGLPKANTVINNQNALLKTHCPGSKGAESHAPLSGHCLRPETERRGLGANGFGTRPIVLLTF